VTQRPILEGHVSRSKSSAVAILMSAFKVPKNETLATPNSGQTLEKPFDYWEKKSGSPLPSTLEKNLRHWKKE